MPIDYETLRIIWWAILGFLLTGFAVMDGFDFGVAMLLPWVAKTDLHRRVALRTAEPVWEGNQVWFVLAGGAIFAAWPMLYATSFSGFYLAMLVLLMGFILRPVGFKYRNKVENPSWRAAWDKVIFLGGFIPALLFGVAVGNVLQGVPFYFDADLRSYYTGSFFGLLNPFAILCGLVSVTMFLQHGGLYLAVKTEGEVRDRAIRFARLSSILLVVLFALAGVWIATGIDGYFLQSVVAHDGPSNPLHKVVGHSVGAWMNNYHSYPLMMLAPALAFSGALIAFLFARVGSSKIAFVNSALSIIGIILTVGLTMFPFLFPSSSNPNSSLLVWDASSSQLTLFVMLIAVAIFMPIILAYTAWVYRVLAGKVTAESVENSPY